METGTHQCCKCLKKSNENGVCGSTLVLPDSVCMAPGGGPHTWIGLCCSSSNVALAHYTENLMFVLCSFNFNRFEGQKETEKCNF